MCSYLRTVLSLLLGAGLGLLRRQLLVQHSESNTDWMHGSLQRRRCIAAASFLLSTYTPAHLEGTAPSQLWRWPSELFCHQRSSRDLLLVPVSKWLMRGGSSLLVCCEHPSHPHKCCLGERQELEHTPLIHQVTLKPGLHTVTAASPFPEITKLASLRILVFFRRGSLGWFLNQSLAIGPFKPGSWVWPLSVWQTDPWLSEREKQKHSTSGLLCAAEIFPW